MGVLNLTDDSFYAPSRVGTQALRSAEAMAAEGAALLDLGPASSRPGARPVPPKEQLERLLPPLRAIRKALPDIWLSVDITHGEVAEAALSEGADLINDISGGHDPGLLKVVAEQDAPYCLMHMRGNPETMSRLTHYRQVNREVFDWLNARSAELFAMGITQQLLDPGFGFAKTPEQSFCLLERLKELTTFGPPVLVGLSRKSMIYKTLGTTPEGSLSATCALNYQALLGGAKVLRVHDVEAARQVIQMYLHLRR